MLLTKNALVSCRSKRKKRGQEVHQDECAVAVALVSDQDGCARSDRGWMKAGQR